MPPKPGFRIRSLHAFTQIDDNDQEGLAAFLDPVTQTWMPMVSADENRFESLRPVAQTLATMSRKPIRVLRFEIVEEASGVIEP